MCLQVSDVKRMNGLVTDLQMFAHPTLRIPLPGRHPPSTVFSADQAIQRVPRPPAEKRNISSAMGLLRGYYGLASPMTKVSREGMEMAVYKSESECHSEDEAFSPPLMPEHRRQWSWSDGQGATDVTEGDRSSERPVRRRGKGEGIISTADSPLEASDRQDTGTLEKMISPVRNSAPSRGPGSRAKETEVPGPLLWSTTPGSSNGGHAAGEVLFSQGGSGGKGLGSSLLGGNAVETLLSKIRRTASATLLQEDKFAFISPVRNRGEPSATPPGLQPSSQSTVRSSVLEGLVKPGSSRRSKTALD